MKAQHLTAMSNNRPFRMFDDIMPTTIDFFSFIEINENGEFRGMVPKTKFELHVSTENQMAVFTLYFNGNPAFINFCNFLPETSETSVSMVEETIRKLGVPSEVLNPDSYLFLYTVPVNPLIPIDQLQIAGEIEFYIWFRIYQILVYE